MNDPRALTGRTVGGRFLITELLGDGGMGAVFRGVEVGGTTAVAIKVLHASLAADPVLLARFRREAQMAAQIDHPNAVRILDTGEDDGIHYLVMELVEGRDLFDVIAESGKLSEARAAAITLQVCDVLSTAHDLGIIHRDLKPENVMLTGAPGSPGGERVKLLDFGVAKRVGGGDGEPEEHITLAGVIVGTPAYMAPEQCRGGVVDGRTDVYACGALLYHLVTGQPPFDDESAVNTLIRHVYEAPLAPSELVPSIDRGLEAIILKALAKRPEDRQQGVHEVWEELLAAFPRLLGKPAHPAREGRERVALAGACHPTWVMRERLCGVEKRPTPRALAPDPRGTTAGRGRRAAVESSRWTPLLLGIAVAVAAGVSSAMWISWPDQGATPSPAAHVRSRAADAPAQPAVIGRAR